jgi:hypothetical protein
MDAVTGCTKSRKRETAIWLTFDWFPFCRHLGELLAFPELKASDGLVAERLRAENAGEEVMKLWQELVNQEIRTTNEDDEF